jgi:hypothetical protein
MAPWFPISWFTMTIPPARPNFALLASGGVAQRKNNAAVAHSRGLVATSSQLVATLGSLRN